MKDDLAEQIRNKDNWINAIRQHPIAKRLCLVAEPSHSEETVD